MAEDNPHNAEAREVVERVRRQKTRGKEKDYEGWGAIPTLQKLHCIAV
jgi:hypothetical protein